MAIHRGDYPYLEELTRLQEKSRVATNRAEAEAETLSAARTAVQQAVKDFDRAKSRSVKRYLKSRIRGICHRFGLPNPFRKDKT